MRVFIARKKINRKYYLIIIFIISIILLNFLTNIILKHFDKEKLLNLITLNSGLNKVSNENKENEPLVYLYNTFQNAQYTNPNSNTYNINPSVKEVNLILKEELKKYKINAIVETESIAKTIEDNNIDEALSYHASRILMEKAKNSYPSLNYFLDIGISEDEREATTYIAKEESLAKVLFIIGTNYDYLDNKKFASILEKKLININKNISRGISYRGGSDYEGIYNQDFSSNTLRIFLGGKENTIPEVNETVKIFAKAISDYIKEDKNAKE